MNHYEWLDVNFVLFLEKINLKKEIPYANSLITADGDKCDSFKTQWEKEGIPFEHGVALYLITKLEPYNKEVRDTPNGWVAPNKWVISNYHKFKQYF